MLFSELRKQIMVAQAFRSTGRDEKFFDEFFGRVDGPRLWTAVELDTKHGGFLDQIIKNPLYFCYLSPETCRRLLKKPELIPAELEKWKACAVKESSKRRMMGPKDLETLQFEHPIMLVRETVLAIRNNNLELLNKYLKHADEFNLITD